MTSHADRDITVIVPVRDAAGLLDECLAGVTRQLTEADRVIVVDDASTDATSLIAQRHGATVHRLAEPQGPYAARQLAADRSDSWALVFIDVRCRVGPGWLESHRELLAQPGVAMSCSGVVTVAGRSLATRVAAHLQPFRFEATLAGHRLPYFPTCNLGVLRAAFDQAGGFAEVRSGGDADLCWRVQDAGLGDLAVDRTARVEWVPREHMGELVGQMARYGRASAHLAAPSQPGSAGRPGSPGTSARRSARERSARDWQRHVHAIRDDLRRRHVSPVVIATTYAVLAIQRAAQAWERVSSRAG